MRFLVDAQLPPALARWLSAQAYDAEHVTDVGLAGASDRAIWRHAASTGAVILMNEHKLLERITVNPQIFGGKPIIRGRRLAVEHVLGMLAAGDSPETILEGYPWLEREDIQACLVYAHKLVGHDVNAGKLTIRVEIDASREGGVSSQQVEEVKSALRELGLDPRVESE